MFYVNLVRGWVVYYLMLSLPADARGFQIPQCHCICLPIVFGLSLEFLLRQPALRDSFSSYPLLLY